MQATANEDKPCLVETGQGLSILYRNRYLYSKYNPAANIQRLVKTVELRPRTLILCFSPILGYGLDTLLQRLPDGCFMLAVEVEEPLAELYQQQQFPAGVGFVKLQATTDIYNLLTKKRQQADNGVQIPPPGSFKYCQRIDFSAAPTLQKHHYQAIHQTAQLAVANFWKNRLTLIKMGRLFHRNMMRNLALLPWAEKVPLGREQRPILVLGAGPSADDTIRRLALSPDSRKKLCLLAVDAVVPALMARKIKPDFVMALECQHAIQQAYTTASEAGLFLLADLTSRPSILHNDTRFRKTDEEAGGHGDGSEGGSQADMLNATGGKTAIFSSEFAATSFLERLRRLGLVECILPPLGSVGVAAVELAMGMRAHKETPIFVSGLDFSYSLGRTHCKGSFQTERSLARCHRLNPPGTYGSLTNPTAARRLGKSGPIYSDQILTHYAQIFADHFQGAHNIFDVGDSGLDLGLPRLELVSACNRVPLPEDRSFWERDGSEEGKHKGQKARKDAIVKLVEDFYLEEEAMLTELREGLSQGTISRERILAILDEADYLYLHFPDGYKPGLEPSFLNRVRAEIDFFLKDIAVGRRILTGAP